VSTGRLVFGAIRILVLGSGAYVACNGEERAHSRAGNAGSEMDSGSFTDAAGDVARGGAPSESGSGGGGNSCSQGCPAARTCCDDGCVNTNNDPQNCGQCGVVCPAEAPFCGFVCNGPPSPSTCTFGCQKAPCSIEAGSCPDGKSCCGFSCCGSGDICCSVTNQSFPMLECHTPSQMEPSCPQGCSPVCVSDRNAKANIEAVDPQAVLEAVSRMPVSTWSYREEPAETRHMGPMAQDFKSAFGLGDSDRYYYSVDGHGVALAAIQGLNALVREQQARIEALEREQRELRENCAPASH
jgi:hypothetical protein